MRGLSAIVMMNWRFAEAEKRKTMELVRRQTREIEKDAGMFRNPGDLSFNEATAEPGDDN